MEFVGREEGRTQTGRESLLVHLDGAIEVRGRLARAPGGADGGLEVAVGEEIKELAVGTPDGIGTVVAVRGEGLDGAGLDVEDFDLLVLVVGLFGVGEPSAVAGPTEVPEVAVHRLRDAFVGFGFDVEDPKLLVFVAMREPVAVGRGDAFPAQDLGVVGPLFGCGLAVGGKLPELRFAR